MEYTKEEAELKINRTGRTIQTYLENEEIHSMKEISRYIRIVNKSGKRVITEEGFKVALNHFGARVDVVDEENRDMMKIMLHNLNQDKQQLLEQINFIKTEYETTKLLANNSEEDIQRLKSENEQKTETIHERELRIKDLEHELDIQKRKSFLQRVFNK